MTAYVLAETSLLELSFAIRLIDDATNLDSLVGDTEVTLLDSGHKALKNKSGYFFFTGISENNVQVKISNKFYFEKIIDINILDLDSRLPVIEERLIPNYLYPFSQGRTLIRGFVKDRDTQDPIANATIRVKGADITNKSDNLGRFVLYTDILTEDDIEVNDGKRCVLARSSTSDLNILLKLEHADYVNYTRNIGKVVEGDTKLILDVFTLQPR